MCKIKLNCNNVNEIREERIANSVYTGSATSHAYVQSSSNPLEISTILVNSFTTSEPPRDTFLLCSEKLTNQETHCLLITTTVCFWSTNFFSLFKRRIIQLEELRRILNCFASVWPKVFFWENKTMKFWKTLKIFEHKSHIYRPLVAFQKLMKGCDFSELFLKFPHW